MFEWMSRHVTTWLAPCIHYGGLLGVEPGVNRTFPLSILLNSLLTYLLYAFNSHIQSWFLWQYRIQVGSSSKKWPLGVTYDRLWAWSCYVLQTLRIWFSEIPDPSQGHPRAPFPRPLSIQIPRSYSKFMLDMRRIDLWKKAFTATFSANHRPRPKEIHSEWDKLYEIWTYNN